MKTYLNRQEKEDYVMLAATQVAADTIRVRWGERGNLTDEETAGLQQAADAIRDVMSSIVKRLAPDQGRALVRAAKSTHCVCVPDERQSTFNRRIAQEENSAQVLVRKVALDDLAEMAIARFCAPCLHADDKEHCHCRAAFLELDVPMFDENPAEGVCPWEIVTEEA